MKDEKALQLLEPKRALTEAHVSKQIKKTIFEVTAGDEGFSSAMQELESVPKAFQEFEKTANDLFIEIDRLCCESEQIRDAGTNSAQNTAYDNLKEQKRDVIEALNAMTTLIPAFSTVKDAIKKEDAFFQKTESLRTKLVDKAFETVDNSIQANIYDQRAAYILETARDRAGKKRLSIFFIVLTCIAAVFTFGSFIAGSFTFWSIFVGPVITLVGFILFLKKSSAANAARILRMSQRDLTHHLEESKRFSEQTNIDHPYKTHLLSFFKITDKVIEKANLKKRFKAELDKKLADTIAAEKRWKEIKPTFEEKNQAYIRRFAEVWGKFFLSIPEEFNDAESLKEICDLLVQKRADTLKEAYPIMEMRQRERRRDQETYAFQSQQRQIALQQAEDQRRAAEYAKQQAQAQEQATEYARQQAISMAATAAAQQKAADFAKQQADSQKKAADYAKQQADSQRRTEALARQIAENQKK